MSADVRGRADGPELAPDVGGVQGGAGSRGEDQIPLAPPHTGRKPVGGLLVLVGAERVSRHLGQGQHPAGLIGLGVPVGAYRPPDGGAGRDGRVCIRIAEVDVFPL